MNKQKTQFLISLCVFGVTACGKPTATAFLAERWDEKNAPRILDSSYVSQFSKLPQEGMLAAADQPWSDTFWPSFDAGIARRWQTPFVDDFGYTPPTEAQLSSMSLQEINQLSPAEKYDIFMGRFDYPFVQAERRRTSPQASLWEGLCHGWAPASLHFREPDVVTVRGKTGVLIPFGSSDVKALLMYNQAVVSDMPTRLLGGRCNSVLSADPAAAGTRECRDVNAGSFHIVLANEIGIRKKGFVADLERDWMVWNHPIYGYSTEIVQRTGPSAGASPEAREEVLVKTTLYYLTQGSAHFRPVKGTPSQLNKKGTFEYRLELNGAGEIVGGEWLTKERPDFIWTQDKAPFEGYYSGLAEIYKPTQR